MNVVKQILSVASKDLFSEVRGKTGIYSLLLSLVVTVSIVAFSTKGEKLPVELSAGLLWIVMVSGTMAGLARVFILEEERGTWLYLRLNTSYDAVYWGKLVQNVLLGLVSTAVLVVFYLLFASPLTIFHVDLFLYSLALGSLGLSVSMTGISAIVSRVGSKGSLLPVLAFPVVLPVLLLGAEALSYSLIPIRLQEASANLGLLAAHPVIVATLTWLVFEYIWQD